MHAFQRAVITASVLSVLLVGGYRIQARGLDQFLKELQAFPHYCCTLREELQRSDRLVSLREDLGAQHVKKVALAKSVIEGDLSLRDAAERFSTISNDPDAPWDRLAAWYPEMPLNVRCGYYMVDLIEEVISREELNQKGLVAKLRSEVKAWQTQR
jgi:hypothetical protein